MTEITLPMIIIINKFDPGGGGSLPLEAVPDAREKMWKRGISKSGVGGGTRGSRKLECQNRAKWGERVTKSEFKPWDYTWKG